MAETQGMVGEASMDLQSRPSWMVVEFREACGGVGWEVGERGA